MAMNSRTNCPEYDRLSRRGFLGASVAATAASLALPRTAFAHARGASRPTLIGIFLRGALDGLSTVVPYGDAALYAARGALAVTAPGTTNGALDLDGYFGLNPNTSGLLAPFMAGNLAFVHAVGSPDPSRSHFDAMRTMESGTPNNPTSPEASGWLARHLQSVSPAGTGALRGLALNNLMPRVLAVAPSTLPIADPSRFTLPGRPASAAARRAALGAGYSSAIAPLAPAAASTFGSIDRLASIDFSGYVPANGATYPVSAFGTVMRNIAAMIKADLGLEVAHYDYGGWDHHHNQGTIQGALADMLRDLSSALEAFWLDMRGMEDKYLLYAKSEFGRRVAPNGNAGTDHGSGGIMLAMGHRVVGGQVHGPWPTVAPNQLDGGDLRVMTDYRDVIAEILGAGLGGTDISHVFAGHTTSPVGVVI